MCLGVLVCVLGACMLSGVHVCGTLGACMLSGVHVCVVVHWHVCVLGYVQQGAHVCRCVCWAWAVCWMRPRFLEGCHLLQNKVGIVGASLILGEDPPAALAVFERLSQRCLTC